MDTRARTREDVGHDPAIQSEILSCLTFLHSTRVTRNWVIHPSLNVGGWWWGIMIALFRSQIIARQFFKHVQCPQLAHQRAGTVNFSLFPIMPQFCVQMLWPYNTRQSWRYYLNLYPICHHKPGLRLSIRQRNALVVKLCTDNSAHHKNDPRRAFVRYYVLSR